MLAASSVDRPNFFREFFPSFVHEYADHRELGRNTNELQVTVVLADGTPLLGLGWRAGPGWIVLFTEEDEMHTVPYEMISKVSVEPRPEPPAQPPPRPPVGFSAIDAEWLLGGDDSPANLCRA
jgi:hypothetical protein